MSDHGLLRDRLGDLSKESVAQLLAKATRKPVSYHPLYSIYRAMHNRCYSEKNPDYHRYGGRGIKVCDRWRNDFWAFVDDMGKRPSSLHSLDRFPNNDGNYEPGNCRWATSKEQSLNSTARVYVPALGKRYIPPAATKVLTPAQESVLHALVACGSHQRAAGHLGLALRTIKAHSSEICRRTNSNSLIRLGIWYAKHFPDRVQS